MTRNEHASHKYRSTNSIHVASELDSLKDQLFQYAVIVAVAAVVAFLGITIVEWRKRQSLPFCDSFQTYDDDSCIRCPKNGKCWKGHLECFPGYNRHKKSCVRPPQTDRISRIISDFMMQQACGKYSPLLCKWTGRASLTETDLTKLLEQASLDERWGIDGATFKLAHEDALNAVKERLVTKMNSESLQELHCPIELLESYKPYWCRTREWISTNATILVIIVPMVLFIVNFLARAFRHRKVLCRAEQLYIQVCGLLEEKARAKEYGQETWVVASHLRDHLLSLSERKDNAAWLMVEKMVHKDSRIDQHPKLIKGEAKVVWEWQVEGTLSASTVR